MSLNLLPLDIVYHILTYDRRFVFREGNLIQINKIDKNKYKFLLDIPKIQILEDNIPEVLLPINESVHFFCLMSTNYNHQHAIELQKLTSYNGFTCVLDIITYNIV